MDLENVSESLAGEWWLPSDGEADLRVGELTFGPGSDPTVLLRHGWGAPQATESADDAIVAVVDFASARPVADSEVLEHPVIHGETVSSVFGSDELRLFTLIDVLDLPGMSTSRAHEFGSYTRRLRGQVLVEGGLVFALEKLDVVSFVMEHSVPRVMSGLGIDGITRWFEASDTGEPGMDLKWRRPKPIEVEIDYDNRTAILNIDVDVEPTADPVTKAVTLEPFVRYTVSGATDLLFADRWDAYLPQLDALIRFMSASSGGWARVSINVNDRHSPLAVHHRTLKAQDDFATSLSEALFFFDSFRTGLPSLVNRWWHLYASYREELEIGLQALAAPRDRERVRRLVVAIEGLIDDDRFSKSSVVDDSKWKTLKCQILNVVRDEGNESLVESFQQFLGHFRNPTMKWRLERLLSDLKEDGVTVPSELEDTLLSKSVLSIRNTQSHGQENPGRRRAFRPEEVRDANDAAAACFNALVLARIGVPAEHVTTHLNTWNKHD